MTRRLLLALLTSIALGTTAVGACAKDGGGDDGGHDDGGHDDDGGNDDRGDDDGGDNNKQREDDGWSQDQALRERQLGHVIPLQAALRIVGSKVRGRVIDIDLLARSGKPQYLVKIRRADGVIQTVRLDARTGRIIRFMGF